MPKFELDIQGQKYEVEAPDESSLQEIADTIAEKEQMGNQQSPTINPSFYSEVISPILAGGSSAAFGIPRLVARAQGDWAEKATFPEQQTLPGKILRGAAETVGFAGGGIGKLAMKAGQKVLPKLAIEGLGRKALRAGIEGATAGALMPPSKGIVNPEERLSNAKWFGITGGALPYLGAGGKKLGSAISKSGRWVAKSIGGVTDSTVKTIKRLGADRVFDPVKAKADYISQELAPKVYQKLTNIVKVADDAYKQAMASAPEGKKIDVRPAIEEAGRRLKRLGLITEKGNLTELGQSEIARDSTYGKLLDFYKSADAISGVKKLQGIPLTQNQMVRASKAMDETLVNKDQFLFLRDKLNSLYKNKPSDIDVSKVVNQFYQSGENSGIKGLQKARELQRKVFEIEDKIDVNKITRDLVKAKNPQWTKPIEEEYKKILGEGNFKDVWDDLMAHFANIDFELVSETPGVGGGFYPSRAGLLRKGIAGATKEYYKTLSPKFLEPTGESLGALRGKFNKFQGMGLYGAMKSTNE